MRKPHNYLLDLTVMIRRILQLVSLGVLVAGCSYSEPLSQMIEVTIVAADGKALVGVPVRYYSKFGCEGSFVAAVASAEGQARMVRETRRGTIAVLLEKPSLCFSIDGKWVSAWEQTVDPAESESFRCILSSATSVQCERQPSLAGGDI